MPLQVWLVKQGFEKNCMARSCRAKKSKRNAWQISAGLVTNTQTYNERVTSISRIRFLTPDKPACICGSVVELKIGILSLADLG